MEKTKIVFVDDESAILQAMRRMLRGHRDKWDMQFIDNGHDAIEYMSSNPVHAIVSDMRMPGMNGAELLNWVKRQRPEVIRIALSGHSDAQMTMESLGATHQFISKPADPGQIECTLMRTLKLRKTLRDKAVLEVVTGMQGIPALPNIYNELTALISRDDFGMDEVGAIIEKDIALSASLLKVVNSAFFGFFGHVESPSQAASVLGVQMLKNLVLSEQVFSHFKDQDIDIDLLTRLNHSSQKIAALANKFAVAIRMDKRIVDHCQIAGFLCHLGDFVCASLLRDQPAIKSGDISPEAIGGHILALWSLPDSVVEAVVFYKKPLIGFGDQLLPVHVVHAAWMLLEGGTQDKPAELPVLETESGDLYGDKMSVLTQLVSENIAEKWLDIYFKEIASV